MAALLPLIIGTLGQPLSQSLLLESLRPQSTHMANPCSQCGQHAQTCRGYDWLVQPGLLWDSGQAGNSKTWLFLYILEGSMKPSLDLKLRLSRPKESGATLASSTRRAPCIMLRLGHKTGPPLLLLQPVLPLSPGNLPASPFLPIASNFMT